jgi:hypothetical protein
MSPGPSYCRLGRADQDSGTGTVFGTWTRRVVPMLHLLVVRVRAR